MASFGCTTTAPGGGGGGTNDDADADDGGGGSDDGSDDSGNGDGDSDTAGELEGGFLYLLQPESVSLDELTAPAYRWLVIEPSLTGDAEGDFAPADIQRMKTDTPCGERTILAYLSVGEAEDYRDYWDTSWVDGHRGPPIDGVAPAWLGPNNPNYPGNYKVRYWDTDWQDLILGTATGPDKTPLDRIIDAGFDGVYLDIIDAYYFWSEAEGGEELSRAQARQFMIEWVVRIADYARNERGVENFLVFPQNAEDIILDDEDGFDALTDAYFEAVSGIGIEDLFYDEADAQPADEVDYRMEQLVEFRNRGETVLVTDYVVDDAASPEVSGGRVSDFYERTLDAGFIPYAAQMDRDLDELVILPSPAWSAAQLPEGCPMTP
jgi:cysteinyl-tRNA synthetase